MRTARLPTVSRCIPGPLSGGWVSTPLDIPPPQVPCVCVGGGRVQPTARKDLVQEIHTHGKHPVYLSILIVHYISTSTCNNLRLT